jgi:ABC-2 type transport system permease protein
VNGFRTVWRKEWGEFFHTWRVWVICLVFAFFAVIGPLLARYQKQLVESLSQGSQSLSLPDGTWVDSWGQWAKNLGQFPLWVLVLVAGGLVASEVKSGTAALVLTKPISRACFVLAKVSCWWAISALACVAGTVVTAAMTAALFDGVDYWPLVRAVGVWIAWAWTVIAVVAIFSCLFTSSLGATGAALGVLVIVAVLSLWGPAVRWSVVGVPGLVGSLATSTPGLSVLWPLVGAIVTTAVSLTLAVLVFTRREI